MKNEKINFTIISEIWNFKNERKKIIFILPILLKKWDWSKEKNIYISYDFRIERMKEKNNFHFTDISDESRMK